MTLYQKFYTAIAIWLACGLALMYITFQINGLFGLLIILLGFGVLKYTNKLTCPKCHKNIGGAIIVKKICWNCGFKIG